MDLNIKTEPKSPSDPDEHADLHVDEQADARGLALAIIVKLCKGALMNKCAKLL